MDGNKNAEELFILTPEDKDRITEFERRRMGENPSLEAQMLSWDARWRPEALDHYLSLGWSFGVKKEGRLVSYLLAQPFIFFRGLTQTLWVEWLAADSDENAQKVIEVIYRWARDKHFQSITLEESQDFARYFKAAPWAVESAQGFLVLKTSKMK